MRHGKKHNHLGRKVGHRRALLRNLAISLITHKRITTTWAKAKALRVFVEPIITTSKDNTQHGHREAFRFLQNKEAVKELFAVVSPAVSERPGGYVRVIRTGTRLGDNAETAIIELVDFNESYNSDKAKAGTTRRRRRRGSGTSTPADKNPTQQPDEQDTAANHPGTDLLDDSAIATPIDASAGSFDEGREVVEAPNDTVAKMTPTQVDDLDAGQDQKSFEG